MTTSMTPTNGDAERWLPDPSWPVPPRGWQLWAAAGPAPRPRRAPDDELEVRPGPEMPHTDGVLSEMNRFGPIEDASFTLPTRPSLLTDHPSGQPVRVDLLAESRAPRRAPAAVIRGFAALTVLLVTSYLVGGVTGALVVIGVSTLLAASAALVAGHISLSPVGGQRGAGLLLGVAVVALMAASGMPRDRPARQGEVPTALVQVSSNRVPDTRSTHAAVPPSPPSSSSRMVVAPAAPATLAAPATPSVSGAEVDTSAPDARSMVGDGVPTLSPDALTPSSARANDAGTSKTAKPVEPVKAVKAAKPERVSEPEKSSKPEKAPNPEKTSKPEKPARPAHPATTCAGRTGAAPVVLRRAVAALGPCGPVRQ